MARTWQIDRPVVQELGGVGEPVTAVHVVLFGGRIDVVAHPGRGSVRLDVQDVLGRPLGVSLSDGALRVEQHKEPGSPLLDLLKGLFTTGSSSARVTLTVPAGAKVSVSTVSADVLVGAVQGDVSINTVSGAVSLSRLAGRVDVKTVSSAVDAAGLSGELKSKSVSGHLTVDESALRSAKLATVSGPLVLDLVGTAGLVTANAVSADITIRIPDGAGYDVTAASQSGHVVVDGQTLSGGAEAEKGGHRFEGDRSFAVKARTASGNIVVLREDGIRVGTLGADTSGADSSGAVTGADAPASPLPRLTGLADDVQDARPHEAQDARPHDAGAHTPLAPDAPGQESSGRGPLAPDSQAPDSPAQDSSGPDAQVRSGGSAMWPGASTDGGTTGTVEKGEGI